MHTGRSLLLAALGWSTALAAFPQSAPPPPDAMEELRTQMREMRSLLDDVRGQLAASNAETVALRREVQLLRAQLPPAASPTAEPAETATADLADQQRLLAAKVDDQYQTKVESASKYQVRLSGMALLTGFSVRGGVDNLDVPETARLLAPGESSGSTGATVRQSMLGIEVFGPEWGGARASGELKVDLFGGFPSSPEGLTAGLLRLRTARLNLDWKNTSLVAGQDSLFFSPQSPTSLVAVAYPALSGTGNLWTWTPQVYVERRFHTSETSHLSLQGGVLDPLTGELPVSEYNRAATAGERSRIPAYALHLAWQTGDAGPARRDRRRVLLFSAGLDVWPRGQLMGRYLRLGLAARQMAGSFGRVLSRTRHGGTRGRRHRQRGLRGRTNVRLHFDCASGKRRRMVAIEIPTLAGAAVQCGFRPGCFS